jgi:hypothetical protein
MIDDALGVRHRRALAFGYLIKIREATPDAEIRTRNPVQ